MRPATAGSRLHGTVAQVVYLGTLTQFHVDTVAGKRLIAHRLSDDRAGEIVQGDEVTLTWAREDAADPPRRIADVRGSLADPSRMHRSGVRWVRHAMFSMTPEPENDVTERWEGVGGLLIGTASMVALLFFLTAVFVQATS